MSLFREGAHARWHVKNYVKKLAFGHNFGIRTLGICKSRLSSPAPHTASAARGRRALIAGLTQRRLS
jgi:hypothetical protein